ncbi:MAG: hypothetical protein JWR34_7454 [Mycobacterium sp.]|jgi:hypothetical protein|nr:hypothetical protein [Mycobacterium sp.]
MSVVVERGSARCPHCVAVADYTFVESELDTVRYEVDCHSCGEVYSEVSSLAPAMPMERILPIPPLPPVDPRPSWRRHLATLGRAAGRLRVRGQERSDRGIWHGGQERSGRRIWHGGETATQGEHGANG